MSVLDKIKIHVVEDDSTYADVIGMRLSKYSNFEISFFEYGEDLLNNLHKNPDIVIVDFGLPDISGFELITKIRTYSETLCLFVLSGQQDIEIVVGAYKAGANNFIVKNEISFIALEKMLNLIVENIKLKRENALLKMKSENQDKS